MIGLGLKNFGGEIIDRFPRLVGQLITTRCGIEGERSTKNLYYHLPLYSDLQNPLSVVSIA